MATRELLRRTTGVVLTALAVSGGAVVFAPAASAADVSCETFTVDRRGHGTCDVRSGEVRLRADCPYQPDRYSGWVGRGNNWFLSTGQCVGSIRGVIVETRG